MTKHLLNQSVENDCARATLLGSLRRYAGPLRQTLGMSDTIKKHFESFIERFPEFSGEWKDHTEWWNGESGIFNDADQIAGYVLDALVFQTSSSHGVAEWLEQSYLSCTGEDKELFEVRVLEELIERLHFVWDKDGVYEDKLQTVLASLRPSTKAWLVGYLTATPEK